MGVANDIEVRLPVIDQRPDPDIVRDAVSALKSELPYSSENIKVIAKDGKITLEGAVEWNYARERAESAVKRIRGVKGVTNSIRLEAEGGPRARFAVRSKMPSVAAQRSMQVASPWKRTAARSSCAGQCKSWAERQ